MVSLLSNYCWTLFLSVRSEPCIRQNDLPFSLPLCFQQLKQNFCKNIFRSKQHFGRLSGQGPLVLNFGYFFCWSTFLFVTGFSGWGSVFNGWKSKNKSETSLLPCLWAYVSSLVMKIWRDWCDLDWFRRRTALGFFTFIFTCCMLHHINWSYL